MKKIIISLIIIFSFIFSNENKLNKIDNIKNKQALKRLIYLNKLKKQLKNEENTYRILNRINLFFNRIRNKKDYLLYKIPDYWATRNELLKNGFGDCEDFAIAKYFTLKELGIKESQMSLLLNTHKGRYHLVLVYQKEKNSPKLVLDSLTNKIMSIKKRKDLKILYKAKKINIKTINKRSWNFFSIIDYKWSKVYLNSLN